VSDIFAVHVPPKGKYAPRVTVSSNSDADEIVQAVAEGKQALTLAKDPEPETDGKYTSVTLERDDSTRNQMLQRLEAEEKKRDEALRSFQPLTEEDAEAKEKAISQSNADRYDTAMEEFRRTHEDFDEVMAQASPVQLSDKKIELLRESGPGAAYDLAKASQEEQERFAAMSDAEAADYLKGKGTAQAESTDSGTEGRETDYDKVLRLASERGNVDGVAETLDRIVHPESPQLAAVNEVMTAVLRNEVPKEQWAAVVHAVLSNPEVVGKLETATSADSIVETIRKTAKTLRLAEIKQRYTGNGDSKVRPIRSSKLGPTRPVGGSLKGTVPLDQADYQTYRREREKQIRAARGR
jgi:hypothetical protein